MSIFEILKMRGTEKGNSEGRSVQILKKLIQNVFVLTDITNFQQFFRKSLSYELEKLFFQTFQGLEVCPPNLL